MEQKTLCVSLIFTAAFVVLHHLGVPDTPLVDPCFLSLTLHEGIHHPGCLPCQASATHAGHRATLSPSPPFHCPAQATPEGLEALLTLMLLYWTQPRYEPVAIHRLRADSMLEPRAGQEVETPWVVCMGGSRPPPPRQSPYSPARGGAPAADHRAQHPRRPLRRRVPGRRPLHQVHVRPCPTVLPHLPTGMHERVTRKSNHEKSRKTTGLQRMKSCVPLWGKFTRGLGVRNFAEQCPGLAGGWLGAGLAHAAPSLPPAPAVRTLRRSPRRRWRRSSTGS